MTKKRSFFLMTFLMAMGALSAGPGQKGQSLDFVAEEKSTSTLLTSASDFSDEESEGPLFARSDLETIVFLPKTKPFGEVTQTCLNKFLKRLPPLPVKTIFDAVCMMEDSETGESFDLVSPKTLAQKNLSDEALYHLGQKTIKNFTSQNRLMETEAIARWWEDQAQATRQYMKETVDALQAYFNQEKLSLVAEQLVKGALPLVEGYLDDRFESLVEKAKADLIQKT